MSTLKFNQWLNSDSTENYKCRAWVNFNGTGTVAIRGSGNVSSITDNGTGDYTVNLSTAMPDANYSSNISTSTTSGGTGLIAEVFSSSSGSVAPTASAFRLAIFTRPDGSLADSPYVIASIFR